MRETKLETRFLNILLMLGLVEIAGLWLACRDGLDRVLTLPEEFYPEGFSEEFSEGFSGEFPEGVRERSANESGSQDRARAFVDRHGRLVGLREIVADDELF